MSKRLQGKLLGGISFGNYYLVPSDGAQIIPPQEALTAENLESLLPLVHSDQRLLHHPQTDLHLPGKAPSHCSKQHFSTISIGNSASAKKVSGNGKRTLHC